MPAHRRSAPAVVLAALFITLGGCDSPSEALPSPRLDSIAPMSVDAGSAEEHVHLFGFAFDRSTVARIGPPGGGSERLETRYIGPRDLTAKIPPAWMETAAILTVDVETTGPVGDASGRVWFVVADNLFIRLEITPLAVGKRHTCAITAELKLWCWGSGADGRLGSGTEESSAEPLKVDHSGSFSAVAAGFEHSCAMAIGATLHCWGRNAVASGARRGAIGLSRTTENALSPTPVPNAVRMARIVLADQAPATCGLAATGVPWCWGEPWADAGLAAHSLPVPVGGGRSFEHFAQDGGHACGTASDRSIWCWGRNADGELGRGSAGATSQEPARVTGGIEFSMVDVAGATSCGLAVDGAAWCWGAGAAPDGASAAAPVALPGGVAFQWLDMPCALDTEGRAWCWDSPADGPTLVSADLAFRHLAAGPGHACGITAAGEGWCWGDNAYGQLGSGDPDLPRSDVPVPVAGGITFHSF